jgi:4-hydroxymandelate oxidase
VLLGRPILWALAAEAAAGVEKVLSRLGEELAAAMALAGVTRLEELTPDLVARQG